MKKRRAFHLEFPMFTLTLPLAVCLKGCEEDTVNDLIDLAERQIGVRTFRDRELTLSLFRDHVENAKKPLTFLYGPYLHLFFRTNGEIGVSVCETFNGPVEYSVESFQQMTAQLTPEMVERAVDEMELREKHPPRRPYAPDWKVINDRGVEFSKDLNSFWFEGRVYDERSARHNGLIGIGNLLRHVVAQDDLDSPSP